MLKRATYGIGILLVLSAVTWALLCARRPNRPPVFVLLLDTLRADHLSVYGYERETTPNLDAFARENARFEYAVPAAPWTPPSVASILTGMYVGSHGLMPPNSREQARSSQVVLNDKVQTLAEILQQSGYATAAISPNPWISKEFGFTQGFERFVSRPRTPAADIVRASLTVIRDLKQQSKPMFVYMHFLDPHDPYQPPGEYAKKFQGALKERSYDEQTQQAINLYDGEISYLDAQVGELFKALKAEKLYDDAIVIIVGDHGEQFSEHGFKTHGFQLFNTEAHVPLLVKLGGNKGQVVHHTVSTIDIFPTILSELQIEKPHQALLSIPLFDEARQQARAGVFSEISRRMAQKSFVSYDGRKIIVGSNEDGQTADVFIDPDKHVVGVFDSRKDYQEIQALTGADELAELREEWKKLWKAINALSLGARTGSSTVSDDTLKQLESLGYLQ